MTIKLKSDARSILANNIVYYRLQKGWSQEDFADKLGTTPTYVSNLENAKRNVTSDFIDKLADSFGVEPHELFIKRDSINNKRVDQKK